MNIYFQLIIIIIIMFLQLWYCTEITLCIKWLKSNETMVQRDYTCTIKT